MVESSAGSRLSSSAVKRSCAVHGGSYHCWVNPILVTGFEPYGGRQINPAHEIMRKVDGRTIGGSPIAGRPLPVAFEPLKRRIHAAIVCEAVIRELNAHIASGCAGTIGC